MILKLMYKLFIVVFFLFSSVKTSEIYFDSDMSDQEFDCLDDADDSDLASDLDEEFLLKEETEMKQDPEMRERSENYQDGKDADMNDGGFSAYVDYTDVPLAQDYAEEEEDDVISLHPDDTLLDEEDELNTNSNRLVRPRLVSTSYIFLHIGFVKFLQYDAFLISKPVKW